MKILVLSDTHHSIDKALEVYRKYDHIDLVIHCGDYVSDALDFQRQTAAKVVYVNGNCDKSFDEKDYQILETECGNLLISHGHMQNVSYSQQSIYYLACENNCIAAIYGHTHIPVNTKWEGVHLINPGSISKPRDGSKGSYALITTSKDGLNCDIIYLDNSAKPKVKGGYLKGLLNYSDRF